jgi:hypothetical protein
MIPFYDGISILYNEGECEWWNERFISASESEFVMGEPDGTSTLNQYKNNTVM